MRSGREGPHRPGWVLILVSIFNCFFFVECKKKKPSHFSCHLGLCHIAELCLLEKFRGLKFKIKFTSDVLIANVCHINFSDALKVNFFKELLCYFITGLYHSC